MIFVRAYITQTANELIKTEIIKTQNKVETGGVLMGYYSRGRELVITHASPPGPKSIQKKRSIGFDISFCQSFVDEIFMQSQRCYTYIGDWHSHTKPYIEPSFSDQRQLSRTASKQGRNLPNPVMLIAYGEEKRLECNIFVYSQERIIQISEFIVLPYDIDVEA
jgi:integrative and conjugative element protein (TIGR02256 family)